MKKQNTISKEDSVIVIEDLHKSFGALDVLKGVTLHVKKGENLVVLGKSGSGKSVLIKCIIGLEKADQGSIEVFDKNIGNLNEKELNEIRIKIGFLFQSGALYDSMTVRENLQFPLMRYSKELSSSDADKQIVDMLDNVSLKDSIEKLPSELSGGMRKRIALARTLILKPEIMLFDEPTTGLDTITSREISELILDLQKKLGMTSIIITHDMPCAKLTADRIVVLRDGEIYAEGTYDELEKSEDEWIRSFFI